MVSIDLYIVKPVYLSVPHRSYLMATEVSNAVADSIVRDFFYEWEEWEGK